ncbi:MAG: hypothetical protein ACJ8BF_06055 [Gemmatimonadales bacterium]
MILAAVTGCGSDLSLPNDGAPARISIIGGDGQKATVGSPVPKPLVVRLTDADSRPVAQVPLVFGFTGEGADGVIDPAVTATDTSGFASVHVQLGTTIGTQTVEARVDAPHDLRATFGLTALEEHGRGKDKGKGHDHDD